MLDLAGLVAEASAAGPSLAAWLSQLDLECLTDRDLPGIAAAFRRLASWAQARELTAVAEIAARSAARDERAGLAEDGRPAVVTRDAAGQVSLALTLSHVGACWWADLAVTLRWRLRATGAALAAGDIDLPRARVIAEATSWLDDEAARRVEARVLPGAGERTSSQLRALARRFAITADPEGAEHRREAAERQAKVSLYPDESHTATLMASGLPAVHAAAAFARISALARAMKAAGAAGGMDFLRAQALLGQVLGTLPLIPPPADGPPDCEPPPDDDRPSDEGRRPDDNQPPDDGRRPDSDEPSDDGPPPGGRPPGDASSSHGRPPPDASGCPDGDRHRTGTARPASPRSARSATRSSSAGSSGARSSGTESSRGRTPACDSSSPGPPGKWDVAPLTDADAPPDDGFRDTGPPRQERYVEDGGRGDPLDDDFALRGSVPPWPSVPAWVPVAAGPTAAGESAASASDLGRPPGGLLDLALPWASLTGAASDPGALGRIGPVTASQARYLAVRFAAGDHAATWRVIVTDDDGRAMAVARMPGLDLSGDPASGPPLYSAGHAATLPGTAPRAAGSSVAGRPMTGLVGRITIVIPDRQLAGIGDEQTDPGGILASVLATARQARKHARAVALADRTAPGGCAHTMASGAYRPPPRTRNLIIARDVTCRFPGCGQPAWHGDLDHTRPWDQGGRTCACNLGALCRLHHILKQHPGWMLAQVIPGSFEWTTSAGRTYRLRPGIQPC